MAEAHSGRGQRGEERAVVRASATQECGGQGGPCRLLLRSAVPEVQIYHITAQPDETSLNGNTRRMV